MKLQVEWIIRFSNDSICIFLSPFLKIIQQRTCNLSNCQFLLSPLSFSFLLKREEKLPSAVDSRKLTNRFLSAAKSSTLCDPRYRVRQGSQNVQTYKDETVSRPFREKTKWMDKCSTFKSSLSKSHVSIPVSIFVILFEKNRLIRDLEKEEETRCSIPCVHSRMDGCSLEESVVERNDT